MIARLSLLLPFSISVRHGDVLQPYELDQGIYKVRIYPPCQAALDPRASEVTSPTSMDEVLAGLTPAREQVPSEMIQMNDASTIQANLLQIDFLKDSFDRQTSRSPATIDEGDPPVGIGFEIANQFLLRLRTLTRAGQIKPLDRKSTYWTLEYLTDAGGQLEMDPALFRKHGAVNHKWHVVGLNSELWNKVKTLYDRNYNPQPWETLLLDAKELLPDVEPAIALANSALECFGSWYLNEIARRRGLPAGLWEWINDRGDWYKEPSASERYDSLLKGLTGKSLKEEQGDLWEAFNQLRKARNSFSHQGTALIGGVKVSSETAQQLIIKAEKIIQWCEDLIPEELRRPKNTTQNTFTFLKQITRAPTTLIPPNQQ